MGSKSEPDNRLDFSIRPSGKAIAEILALENKKEKGRLQTHCSKTNLLLNETTNVHPQFLS